MISAQRAFRVAFSFLALAAAGVAISPVSQAATDPLAAAFAVALANPTNIEAQLAYGRAAEAAGKFEAAFPVYERVLALDPRNGEAQAGLRRIRTIIQPARHDTYVEFGGAYETNPLLVPSGADPEFQLYGNLYANHENTFGEHRFRTIVRAAGVWHAEQNELNYAFAGAVTGPLIDIGAESLLHVAAGGGVAMFGGRLFYSEAMGMLTYETGQNGATQTVRLRGAWRQYDPFWVSDQGFWADLTGKFIWPKPDRGGAFILTPWMRWSGVNGTIFSNFGDDIAPGKYFETGTKAEYLHEVSSWLTAGLNVSFNYRHYNDDVVPFTTTARQDFTFSPGASLILPHVHDSKVDVRLRYNYILNQSNDDDHDFTDHIVALSLGTRF